jgi:Polyketide cyclase / dehydrase and lipid transport
MATVRVSGTFEASPAEAERRWYDTGGWPRWVDGLDRVVEVGPGWPNPGAEVVWVSGPAGRGRVVERVTERVAAAEPGAGQTSEVEDDSITARQTVSFIPLSPGVQVELELDYRLKRRTPLTPIVDALFIRRAFTASLRRTLTRFAALLAASPSADLSA